MPPFLHGFTAQKLVISQKYPVDEMPHSHLKPQARVESRTHFPLFLHGFILHGSYGLTAATGVDGQAVVGLAAAVVVVVVLDCVEDTYFVNKSTRPPDIGLVEATVGIVFGVGFTTGTVGTVFGVGFVAGVAVVNLLNKSTRPPDPGFISAGTVEAGVGMVFGVGLPAAAVVNLLNKSTRPPLGIGFGVVVVDVVDG